MRCAWQAYLNILPIWMRRQVDRYGQDTLQETRLRLERPAELITAGGSIWLDRAIQKEDLDFVVNTASHYSPWTSETIAQGYITAPGGHRIGLCGESAGERGNNTLREVTSLCIRTARDFPGISRDLGKLSGSLLIIGRPGSGKTTLLRDLVRQRSDCFDQAVAVVDERCELFPRWQNSFCFPPGRKTDVLSGCKKTVAVETLLRTMNPQTIALDEVTATEDCDALLRAAWCGAQLVSTAHADSMNELRKRSVYRKLLDSGVFSHYIVMRHDQTWVQERVEI